MIVKFASDLHLEFDTPKSVFKEESGDILILAGDIVDGKLKGLDTLKYISSNFNHVIMIMGNHEHYRGRFDLTYNKLKNELPNNIHLLENDIINIDGQRFLGCTLWTWMNEVDSYFAKVLMNDYRVKTKYKGIYRKLNPSDTIRCHMQSALWLESNVKEDDIVVTHHAPSFLSCNPDYTGNTAYATDLSDIMLDCNPSHWIHGHLHTKISYKIGNTHVISNPMGYFGHEFKDQIFRFKEITC